MSFSGQQSSHRQNKQFLVLYVILNDTETEKSKRVMKAMAQMDKLDIDGLKQAYEQHNEIRNRF